MSLATVEGLQSKSSQSYLGTNALRRTGRLSVGLALGLSVCLLVSSKVEANTFKFQKVADTNTPIPGGTGNFTSFFYPPSLDNRNVAFSGSAFSSSLSQSGIYIKVGNKLRVVADLNTPVPGSTENFFSLGVPSVDNRNVAFLGLSGSFPDLQQGIYTNVGSKLNVVADRNTPVPAGTGNFTDFNNRSSVNVDPSLDNGNVAFRGYGGGGVGIYTNIGGKLNVVANTNTPIPRSTGNFTNFSDSVIDKGSVAFIGASSSSSQQGIYTNIGGKLNVVADSNTPIPGGKGNFRIFINFPLPSARIAFDDGNVAFTGFGSGSEESIGIYTNIGGKLNVVADTNTPIPGGVGKFKSFSPFPNAALRKE